MSTEFRATTDDGVTLAVSDYGNGRPLLMIPGLGASRFVYDPIIPALAEHFRVLTYDPRGIGDSDASDGPYTMAQLARDAVSVLDAAGESRAAVFGASMGGMVAQHVALNFPDHLSALILAATGPGGAHAAHVDPSARAALMGVGSKTPADAYRLACTVLYSETFQQSHPDFVEDQIAFRAAHPVRGRAFSAQVAATRGHGTYAQLPSIGVPTLVMHGGKDVVSPVANAERIAGEIPGAKLHLFPELGHLFFHEDPKVTADVMTLFLERALRTS